MSDILDAPEKIVEEVKPIPLRPWKVIMHNDDFTDMNFVMRVLMDHFSYGRESAYRMTLLIHMAGDQVVGTFYKEIAELKADVVMKEARDEGHPLKLTVTPE